MVKQPLRGKPKREFRVAGPKTSQRAMYVFYLILSPMSSIWTSQQKGKLQRFCGDNLIYQGVVGGGCGGASGGGVYVCTIHRKSELFELSIWIIIYTFLKLCYKNLKARREVWTNVNFGVDRDQTQHVDKIVQGESKE